MAAPKGHKKWGGKPKGYRSRATLDKIAAREYVRQKITAALDPILDAHIANAVGRRYLVKRDKKTGKFIGVTEAMARQELGAHEEIIEVWEKDPSAQASVDLLNRAIDKPAEQINVTGDLTLGVTEALLARLDRGRKRATPPPK